MAPPTWEDVSPHLRVLRNSIKLADLKPALLPVPSEWTHLHMGCMELQVHVEGMQHHHQAALAADYL